MLTPYPYIKSILLCLLYLLVFAKKYLLYQTEFFNVTIWNEIKRSHTLTCMYVVWISQRLFSFIIKNFHVFYKNIHRKKSLLKILKAHLYLHSLLHHLIPKYPVEPPNFLLHHLIPKCPVEPPFLLHHLMVQKFWL